mmetsp:Transcript_106432/g.307983  ORF Transcript_106432/g.307983 Transcript_106432/m.307983 type:complete len:259 (+) Transcript_106432:434-1210(+)
MAYMRPMAFVCWKSPARPASLIHKTSATAAADCTKTRVTPETRKRMPCRRSSTALAAAMTVSPVIPAAPPGERPFACNQLAKRTRNGKLWTCRGNAMAIQTSKPKLNAANTPAASASAARSATRRELHHGSKAPNAMPMLHAEVMRPLISCSTSCVLIDPKIMRIWNSTPLARPSTSRKSTKCTSSIQAYNSNTAEARLAKNNTVANIAIPPTWSARDVTKRIRYKDTGIVRNTPPNKSATKQMVAREACRSVPRSLL